MEVKFHIPPAAERQAVAVELQGVLVDLLDLTLIGKHAIGTWRVRTLAPSTVSSTNWSTPGGRCPTTSPSAP